MRKIPNELREQLSNDPFMKTCCLAYTGLCEGRVEFHHNLIYAGRQQNQAFCILPVCHGHHLRADIKPIKLALDKIMISRMTDEDRALYPRRKW